MGSRQNVKSRGWQLADRVGTGASLLCAIHCAVLPFVLVLLPVMGLGFLANDRFESGFVMFASVLAMIVLTRGFRRHQQPLPLVLAVLGIALLLLGVTSVMGHSVMLHSVLVSSGGLSLASAHFFNLRTAQRLPSQPLRETRCVH
ncbi:MAG: MerC domain-containing protein [Rhodanobacter sp.]